MSADVQFQVIDKVVAQGEQRLTAMFRETMEHLDEVRTKGLSPEAEADLNTLIEAYKLTHALAKEIIDFKDNSSVLGLLGKKGQ